jgi:hypothetical protein
VNFFIGSLEDNLGYFVLTYLLRFFGEGYVSLINYPFGVDFFLRPSNQPLFHTPLLVLGSTFNSMVVYNVVVVLSVALALVASFWFFKHFLKSGFISVLCSFIFVFSSYFYYHSKSHLDLIQVWALVVFVLTFLKAKTYLQYFLSGAVLVAVTLISNYLGFVGIVFVSIYCAVDLLLTRGLGDLKKKLISIFVLGLTFILGAGVFLLPYIEINYFSEGSQIVGVEDGDSWKIVQDAGGGAGEDVEIPQTGFLSRPLEDFFVFSSRPWYYFLPSVDNPFLGSASASVIEFLQNSWGYWLTSNYFVSEHSTSYLGYVNLLFAAVGVYAVYRGGMLSFSLKTKKVLGVLLITAFGLAVVSMPPYFTINLKEYYLPSYFIWKVFPMFRVLSRLGILVLLIELVFTGVGFMVFAKFIAGSSRKFKKLGSFVILIPFTLSLMEFYVPPEITKVEDIPEVYTYIKLNTPEDSVIAVYPLSSSEYTLFWMQEHGRAIINTGKLERPEFGFYPKDFTQKLPTCVGILEARNLGATHILSFAKGGLPPESYFESSNMLTKIYGYENNDFKSGKINSRRFFEVNDIGSKSIQKVSLYRINEEERCLWAL